MIDYSAQNDGWSKGHDGFVKAMNERKYSLFFYWGPFGHANNHEQIMKVNDLINSFDWLSVRKNEAYPVFNNATTNDPLPWPDNLSDKKSGQVNAFFRWKNLRDTPEAVEMSLFLVKPSELKTTFPDPDRSDGGREPAEAPDTAGRPRRNGAMDVRHGQRRGSGRLHGVHYRPEAEDHCRAGHAEDREREVGRCPDRPPAISVEETQRHHFGSRNDEQSDHGREGVTEPTMKPFEFHAELFDFRNAVLETLSDNGFAWLSDFGSVDLQHDVYGLEVTGIREEADARAIEALLRRMFVGWRYGHTFYEDQNLGELGWKVMISREPEHFDDNWQRAG